jgi:hypothetical protein
MYWKLALNGFNLRKRYFTNIKSRRVEIKIKKEGIANKSRRVEIKIKKEGIANKSRRDDIIITKRKTSK